MAMVKTADLERLTEDYPHLEEKAIVNFINGLSVMSDHLNEKCKIASKTSSTRFFDWFTGKSAKRQELIDRTVENSLIFIKDYVISNEKRLAKNEHFLRQVMDGISMVSTKLKEVVGDTIALRENLTELACKVDSMEQSLLQRMDYYELQNSAMIEMKFALSVFASKDAIFSPEQSLWMLLTRLKCGDFGSWIEQREGDSKHEENVQKIMKMLRMECLRILEMLTGRSIHELVDRKALFSSLSSGDELLQEVLCLVSEHNSNALESVILTINSDDIFSPDAELPFVFSSSSIYDEMSRLFESGDGYAATN